MKKLLAKIRNKRLKGNVSLLVILILLASSVIGLLSISQIQHLLTYWDMTFNYFRAFYLAKAWTELGLTEIYNRENWFEDEIKNNKMDDDSINFQEIIKNNFMWPDNKYESAKPYFDMKIVSNFDSIVDDVRKNECNDNKITLKGKSEKSGKESPWEGIVLQLFKDETSWLDKILKFDYIEGIKWLDNNQVKGFNFDQTIEWKLMLWLFSYDNKWDMTNIIVKEQNDLKNFLEDNAENISWTRRYLSIKNIWDQDVIFCINNTWWSKKIPYSHYLVTVRGNYADMEVWLQSVVKKDFPSWSLDVLWWEWE